MAFEWALAIAIRAARVNSQPEAVTYDREGRVVNVISLDLADGRVQTVRSILNPDKLRHLGPVADLRALLKNRGSAASDHPLPRPTPLDGRLSGIVVVAPATGC